MQNRPLLVGLTGLPGSGKTSFAAFLKDQGAEILSADEEGHRVLDEEPVRRTVFNAFGADIAAPNGAVDRRALGARLSRAADVETLNRLVHPRLLQCLAGGVRKAMSRLNDGLLVIDAALIPEWGIEGFFDLVVFVATPMNERYRRLSEVGRDLRLIRILEDVQFAEDEKRVRCHIVIDNTATIAHLRRRADALFRAIAGRPCKEETWQRKLWTG